MASVRVSGSGMSLVVLIILVVVAVILLFVLPIWALGIIAMLAALLWPGIPPWGRTFLFIAGLLFLIIGLLLGLGRAF